LICIVAQTCFAQIPPDSLIGIYAGQKYYKPNPYSNWTITNDTEYVKSIDTTICKALINGCIFWGTGTTSIDFYTDYYFCFGNPTPQMSRPKFYGGDSLRIICDSIPTPPPTTHFTYTRFFGKRMPGTLWVGINEVAFANNITIFPNPFNDKILLKLPATADNSRITIYNMMGQNVFDKTLNNSETSIDLSFLHKGVYSMIIGVGDKRNFYKKIIKK